jgi:YgiT-type zinc finger domain-containing protein
MIGRRAKNAEPWLGKCYFCKGELTERLVNVDFRWGRKLKVILSVPSRVCRQCGEKYFHSAVYKSMEKLVVSRAKPSARVVIDVVQFKKAV